MDRFQRHLDTIPLGTIGIVACAVILVALIVPKRFGFYASIFMFAGWVNLDRFKDLQMLSSAAKVTYWLPPVMLLFFAAFLPGPRRPVPVLAWIYLLCSIFGVFCITSAEDSMYGLVQFSTMFLYAAAGITLYRVTTTNEQLVKVVTTLFLGLLVPIGIGLSALLIFRSGSFRLGIGRFQPFGMLGNQYVHVLATACCFAGFYFMKNKTRWVKLFCLGVVAVCGAMLLASASRQGLVIVGIAMLPSIAWGARHPIGLAVAIACALAAGVWVFAFTEGVGRTERLADFTHTSGRYETQKEYIAILLSRPAGLLGTRGHLVNRDFSASHFPHNAYLRMAYLGGFGMVIPLFLVGAKTLLSTIYVVKNRKKTDFDETLLISLALLLLAFYLQGVVNEMTYVSVASCVLLHYFLSCFFMGTAADMKAPAAVAWQYGPMSQAPAMR